jgi:hypothetical protein
VQLFAATSAGNQQEGEASMTRRVLIAMAVAWAVVTRAGAETLPAPTVRIPHIQRAVTLEQFLPAFTDSAFSTPLARAGDLVQRAPSEGSPVSERTDVYLGQDERAVYIMFVCFDREMGLVRSRLVGRDKIPDDDDNVAINIDTFHDRQHAYGFELNAAGVQLDGLFSESAGWDFSYDMVWSSDVRRTPQGYVALFAIPFNALRFAPGNPEGWGLFLYRGIPRKNEDDFWPQISSAIAGRLRQMGDVRGLETASPGGTTQFVPYASYLSGRSLDLAGATSPHFASNQQARGGLDTKFTIHNSLVVDGTYNPDFSQVESDQPQETLNQRFEVFFPELRPFFLENASYFGTPLELVFTRRIVDPQVGARMTGRLGPWALGALVSDDRAPAEGGSATGAKPGDHALVSALRVSHDVGHDDHVGMIFTERSASGVSNAVGGLDGRATLAQSWVANGQFVMSATDEAGVRLAGQASEVSILRSGRLLKGSLQYDDISPDFRSDVGFITRTDLRDASGMVSYRFRPEGRWLIAWGPDLFIEQAWDYAGERVGATCTPRISVELTRGTTLSVFRTFASEVLRPQDFATLATNRGYGQDRTGFTFGSSLLARCVVSGSFSAGEGVDYVPPAGMAPEPAKVVNASATFSLRATNALTVDGTYIVTRVDDALVSATHFDERFARAVVTYQFTHEASLRTIVQSHNLSPDARFTSAELTKQLTADVLFTYLVHPYTALYVGYTRDRQNIDPALTLTNGGLARSRNSMLDDGRQLFVKLSYLIRP